MAKTEKLSAYYDKEEDGDLKTIIKKLKKSSQKYQGRSESEILRMILKDALPAELKKAEGISK